MNNPFEKFASAASSKQETPSDPPRRVPEAELTVKAVRSSGPGGQNVNKVSSKIALHWNVDASTAFTPEEKAIIKQRLANRINKAGELYLDSQSERSQPQNRAAVVALLNELITEVLKPQIERIATQPTKGAKERRLEEKKKQARKKQQRGRSREEY